MKPLNCISNACSNILYKKSYAFRMIIGMAFITAVIQSSFLIFRVIQNYYDNTIYDKIIKNAVTFSTEVSEKSDIPERDTDMFKILSKLKNTTSPVCSIPLDTMGYIKDTEHKYIRLSRTTMVCDGISYTGKEKNIYNLGEYYTKNLSFDAELCLSEYDIIDINTEKQFEHYYPDEKLFLYGGPAQKSGEIMINSYILLHYGVDDPNSIIGKNVAFFIDGIEYIKNLRVAGVINEKYFNMKSTALKSDIIIYDSLENIADYCIGGEDVQFYLPIDNLLDNIDVYNAVEQLGTNDKVVCSESSLIGLSYTEKLSEVSKKILSVICVFIIFSMILSVFSIIKTNIISSCNYYGMLSAIGMSRISLFVSYFFEQVLLIVAALLVSFPIYEIFVLFINKIISVMISDEIIITISQLLKIYTISSIICFVVIFIMSCFVFLSSIPKNIVTSLK